MIIAALRQCRHLVIITELRNYRHLVITYTLLTCSPLSASTLRSVPARIMTCQCLRSSAISVVIWFLAISTSTRSRHLSFGVPRFIFPSTVICNISLVASSLSLLCTCPNHINLFSLRKSAIGCVPLSRCLHFSHDLVSSFVFPTAACAFQVCAISSPSF